MGGALRNLTGTTAAVAVTAVTGGLASAGVRSAWYETLDKPPFQPPAQVFPVAWTALYADIAVVSGVVLTAMERGGRSPEARSFRTALAVNLVANAGWSWVFFRAHRLLPAAAVAGLLALSSADLARRSGGASPYAAAALAPYPLWCGFATALSTAIWRRNR
jgi:tryptophan-rich sensory protein